MSQLPSGTVSLLFSDIEGSTALLSRLGPAYADALGSQRQVLCRALAEHGGTELGTEGDSFMVVFNTAEAAVKAATQAQQQLAASRKTIPAEEWEAEYRAGRATSVDEAVHDIEQAVADT